MFQCLVALTLIFGVTFGRTTFEESGVRTVCISQGVVEDQSAVDEPSEATVVFAVVLLVLVVVLALIIYNNSVKGGS